MINLVNLIFKKLYAILAKINILLLYDENLFPTLPQTIS